MACGSGDLEFLERWARLEANNFRNFLDSNGNGAAVMVSAARRNRPDCVEFMLHHVDANVSDPKGHRPLVEASTYGNVRVMRILLDHGADPNLADVNNRTPLCNAASHGLREAVLLLLERGADVNLQYNGSAPALSEAAKYGYLEVMRDLFAAGADHGLVNPIWGSALLMATIACQPEAAGLLLAWGRTSLNGNPKGGQRR
jgi:ankyrin repeat protein